MLSDIYVDTNTSYSSMQDSKTSAHNTKISASHTHTYNQTLESNSQSSGNQTDTNRHPTNNTKLSTIPFFESKEDSLAQDTQQYYHCYDIQYQQEGKCLQDGIYYLSTSQIQEVYNASQQQAQIQTTPHNSHNNNNTQQAQSATNIQNLVIYADEQCLEQRTTLSIYTQAQDNTDSKNDQMIHILPQTFQRFAQATLAQTSMQTTIPLKVQLQYTTNIESIHFIESIQWELNTSNTPQPSTSQTKIEYFDENRDKNTNDTHYPFNYTFAPGTYIELQAKINNKNPLTKPLHWGYVALSGTQEDIQATMQAIHTNQANLQPLTDRSGYFINQNQYDKIGFYLPLAHNACILVYASLDSIDTSKDTFILIRTDFSVGKDSNGSVIESKREGKSHITNRSAKAK